MNDSGIATVFDEIYESTYRKTLVFVTRRCGHIEDIADILQETYAEVYRVLSGNGVQYIAYPMGFVLRVARTQIHRHYATQEKRIAAVPLTMQDEDGEEWDITDREWTGPSVEDQVVERLVLREVAEFLRSRPDPVQRAIYLHYYLDMPLPQVAAALSAKESTVKSWIYRTLRDIREKYEREGEHDERT